MHEHIYQNKTSENSRDNWRQSNALLLKNAENKKYCLNLISNAVKMAILIIIIT